MAERLPFELSVTGQAAASQNLRTFDRSLQRTGTTAATTATRVTGAATGATALGTAVRTAAPGMAMFAGSLGTAGTAVSGLTTVLGGPGGLLAGGLIAVIGIAANALSGAGDEVDDLKEGADKASGSLRTLSDHLSDIRKEQQARHRQSLIDLNLDPDLLEAEARKRQEVLDRVNQSLRDLPEAVESRPAQTALTQKRIRLEREIADLRSRATASAREEAGIQNESANRAIEEAEAEAKKKAAAEARAAAEKRVADQKQRQADFEALMGQGALTPGSAGGFTVAGDLLREQEQRDSGRLETWLQEQQDIRQRFLDRQNEAESRAKDQRLALLKEEEDARMGMYSRVSDAAGQMFAAIVTGQADMVPRILASLGQQMLAEGAANVLRGIAMTAMGNPSGVVVAKTGGAMIALGGTLGAAGAAGGGFSGGNASGLGGQQSVRQMGDFGQRRDNSGGGGGDTIVVHMQSLTPDEQAGLLVGEAVKKAKRTRGESVIEPFQRGR